ncbi:helix-turn-helix domain-containing protein [Novosphingobium sp.]|uniref:TetR/AcrR family transcriptional regulator n=1 Tax=Novosphingobium sp. TaxID=1874826 RepID=UPI00286E709A|nr:helix-turn-helix domain-containing protein [Novosphingobium sp.]
MVVAPSELAVFCALRLSAARLEGKAVSERIRQPRQSRSQESMIRILDAFEKLLRKDDYEAITINDIARESATGAGSIYARFDGKQSILLALHARARERARRYFHALFNPEAKSDESLEAGVERIVRGMLAWHKRNRSIIKTSLLLNDADIYRAISNSFHPWNERLALLLLARDGRIASADAAKAASAILQITTAALQQWVIFGAISPIGADLSEEDLVTAMVAACLGQVNPLRS